MQNHNELFIELIDELFFELLDLFFPPYFMQGLDRSSHVEVDNKLPPELDPGVSDRVDIVLKVNRLARRKPLLFHIEMEPNSGTAYADRMLYYYTGLSDRYKLEIVPIAILAFRTPRKPQQSSVVKKFGELEILHFGFKLIQLNMFDWRDFLYIQNPVAPALMPLMDYKPRERVEVRLNSLIRLAEIAELAEPQLTAAQISIVWKMIDAYAGLTKSEAHRFNEELAKLKPEIRSAIATYITS